MNLSPLPIQKFFDNNGRPLNGGLLFTYAAGTTTKIATYQDQAGTPNTNPVVLNFRGEANVWLDQTLTYKFVLAPSNDTDPPSSPFWTVDNISAAVTYASLTRQILGRILYPQSAAEMAINVTPTNYFWPWGYVDRYGTNAIPGTTDMTAAINTCANVCRQGNYVLMLPPETCLVSDTLNFNRCHVVGTRQDSGTNIQASSAQFDVISCETGGTFENFRVDGGWDQVSAGQNGDVFSLVNNTTTFAYLISFRNVTVTNAKRRGIYWRYGGYGSITNCHVIGCGLHALVLDGISGATPTSVVQVNGMSQFSTCPNGYGIVLTSTVNVALDGCVVEETKGLQINGSHRSLYINEVYQEFGTQSVCMDFGTSDGIGLVVTNCFAVGTMTNVDLWNDVHIYGNSFLSEPAIPLASRVLQADGGELTTSTTGGVNVTAASINLPVGTWTLSATLQTVQSTASGLSQVAAQLTTNSAASGLNNATNAGFNPLADEANYNPGTNMDLRMNLGPVTVRVTAATTYYLRARLVFSGAGVLAYHGFINAVKLQ